MYLDQKAILASIHNEEVIKIAQELGCHEFKTDAKGNICLSTALCHGGDSPYKLVYYDDADNPERTKGRFKCYTCGDSYDVVEWVIRALRLQGKTMTWYKALYFIAKTTGKLIAKSDEEVSLETNVLTDFRWINQFKALKNKRVRSVPELKGINENVLDLFCYIPHEEWLNEHISRQALSRYGIGYYPLTDQIVIPHYSMDDRLIGIRGRWLTLQDMEHGKYMPMCIEGITYNHALGNNLYGLNVVKDKVKRCHKIMLVEAEKSCLQAYSYYEDESFVVAVCGNNITKTQIKMMIDLGVEEVLIGFDRDYHRPDSFEAELCLTKIMKKALPLTRYFRVALVLDNKDRLPYKGSPTDCGVEVLNELMDEKMIVTADSIKEYLNAQSEDYEEDI